MKLAKWALFTGNDGTDLKAYYHAFRVCWELEEILDYGYLTFPSKHRNLIVTLGKDGARFNGNKYTAPKVNVADVCGAGDTHLAALAYMYCQTEDMEHSIRWANRAASVTVQHLGVYAPTLEEINGTFLFTLRAVMWPTTSPSSSAWLTTTNCSLGGHTLLSLQ